ncbi:MAG: alpha/beta hydrolase [Chloroflexi bacterium]|nr:alpha/beta hydrolase [Chloroflexota bacterium]
MANLSRRFILSLALLLAAGLPLAGCQLLAPTTPSAAFALELDPSAGAVTVRADLAGLAPGELTLAPAWDALGAARPDLEWLRVAGSEEAPSSGPTPSWVVQVPANGRLSIAYRLAFTGDDGDVPSRVESGHALLRTRSLFVLPAGWLAGGGKSTPDLSVALALPEDWAVYSPWPYDPERDLHRPADVEALLSSALAVGGYLGYELASPPLTVRLFVPKRYDLDYTARRAAEMAHAVALAHGLYGYTPDLGEALDLWIVLSTEEVCAEARAELLSRNILLVRTDRGLALPAERAILREALGLWNGLAIRLGGGDSGPLSPESSWLAQGWNEYLAWRLSLEAGRLSPVAYWDRLREVARAAEIPPDGQPLSLAEAAERAADDPAMLRYASARAELAALLLDQPLENVTVDQGRVIAALRHLGKTQNHWASGETVTVNEVIAALGQVSGPEAEAHARELFGRTEALELDAVPQLVAPAAETRAFLTPDGLRLSYLWVDGASDRAAIYLHGGPGDAPYDALVALSAPLAPYLDVAYLEQRGCGRSDRPGTNAYTLDAFVNDVEVLRAELGRERITLIGHAWGSLVALHYAQRYPERVEALVLASPIASYAGLVGEPPSGQDALQAAYERLVRAALLPPGVSLRNDEILPTLRVRDRLMQQDPTADWVRGEYPVLLLRGQGDAYITAELAANLRERLGAQLREIPGAGHYLYLDAPDATAGAIAGFLGEQP